MLVFDNGAYSIKVTDESGKTLVIPNCVARSKDDRRIYVANELDEKTTLSTIQYKRPHEKGYLTAWHVQKPIWDRIFATKLSNLDRHKTGLILTEAPYTPTTLQANTDEMVFEDYLFAAYIRTTPAALIPWAPLGTLAPLAESCHEVVLVVDSGYSFTHITTVINGVPRLARRLNVGGKMLTNVLKEQISFRQYNMMDETQLINDIKEECCFVSMDFDGDMERARQKSLRKRYVLPDLIAGVHGYLATAETEVTGDMQILELCSELFTVPELLFRPSDIGLAQGGIVEGVMDALRDLPDEVVSLCLEHIVLIGGNIKFPGFLERFERDLRALAPDEFEICVYRPDDPITFASQSGHYMAQATQHVQDMQVTKAEYLSSNKRASTKFNQVFEQNYDLINSGQHTPFTTYKRKRETIYDETSDRSDTPRSFSPDTEPEDQVMQDSDDVKKS